MGIEHINIFLIKALQNLPKLGGFENKPSGNPDSVAAAHASME
jgi:hypothetical protein